jgi:hypothetical protein
MHRLGRAACHLAATACVGAGVVSPRQPKAIERPNPSIFEQADNSIRSEYWNKTFHSHSLGEDIHQAIASKSGLSVAQENNVCIYWY